ncbi:MAG: helix-turn-helix domain-containing protein [Bdellovibrionales bacterium]
MKNKIIKIQERVEASGNTEDLTAARRQQDARLDSKKIFENRAVEGDLLTHLDRFLSPENAARYLDVSRKFIYELMARGEIEVTSVGGRLKRIRLSTLDAWLNRQNRRREA